MTQWYYRSVDGEEVGPVLTQGLKKLLQNGALGLDDEVRREDEQQWRKVSALQLTIPSGAPSPAAIATTAVATPRPRMRVAMFAGIAVAFVGALWVAFAFGRANGSAAAETTRKETHAVGRTGSADIPQQTDAAPRARVDEPASVAVKSDAGNPARTAPTDSTAEAKPAAAEDQRREYCAVAGELMAGTRVIYSWLPNDGEPVRQVAARLGTMATQIRDPILVDALQRARVWWRGLPKALPVLQPDSFEAILLNVMIGEVYDLAAGQWSASLGDLQENCWRRMMPILEGHWGNGPEIGPLATVTVHDSKRHRGPTECSVAGAAKSTVHHATIMVTFECLDAPTIVNHYYFDEWEPSASLDLSDDRGSSSSAGSW